MKNCIVICCVIAVVLVFAPLIGLKNSVQGTQAAPQTSEESQQTTEETVQSVETITIFRHLNKTVEEMELAEYAVGAVAGEMPAVYGIEALKAQAAVCLNIARREIQNGAKTELLGAQISDDSASHQCCMTTEEMREKWGDNYNVYYNKIKEAVDEVYDCRIMYGNELASTVFHAVSAGKTESAKNVWGNDVAYLRAVDSTWDTGKKDFESTLILSAEAFSDMLSSSFGIKTEGEPAEWVKNCVYSDSGTLLSAEICSTQVGGTLLRSKLSLRSAAIGVEYDGKDFIFTVKGYGHGVGMSQYGASQMAQEGKLWREIILHYYPGTEIV